MTTGRRALAVCFLFIFVDNFLLLGNEANAGHTKRENGTSEWPCTNEQHLEYTYPNSKCRHVCRSSHHRFTNHQSAHSNSKRTVRLRTRSSAHLRNASLQRVSTYPAGATPSDREECAALTQQKAGCFGKGAHGADGTAHCVHHQRDHHGSRKRGIPAEDQWRCAERYRRRTREGFQEIYQEGSSRPGLDHLCMECRLGFCSVFSRI